ncbi:MAG: D-cysteine desulfhydrase family protein [Clostridiales bacterium]|nr:D-cysteine desulfhydrase family protein [Clostridiales bacterium]
MLLNDAKILLEKLKRANVGFFPTPFHKLERLSDMLGVELYIKRDDFTGVGLFGGNKIRKLQYFMADALEKGAEYVFTFGATQSNHAMQTATACRRCGLKPVLYLMSVVEPDAFPRSNLLLDRVFDAEVHIVPPDFGKMQEAAREHMARLEAEGHKCYEIPGGGAAPLGSAGYIEGYCEMAEQAMAAGFKPDYVFHATGSGGTLAGLMAGHDLIGCGAEIHSVLVGNDEPVQYVKNTAELANKALELIGAGNVKVRPEEFHIETEYYLPGYEQPNSGTDRAIKLLAVNEGILVDPVYSGKAFYGMLDSIESGKVPKGSSVLFWHTGGATSIFAEKEIIGNIY